MNEDRWADHETLYLDSLQEVRQHFKAGRYQLAISAFEGFDDISAVRSGIRVEAICLTARSLIQLQQPTLAKSLLKRVGRKEWTSAGLCAHVAVAYIELGEYKAALPFLERAALLSESTRTLRPKEAAET